MVRWSLIQAHHKGIQLPFTWYIHNNLIGHYSDLTPTIPYRKLEQYKMGQCRQCSAIQPAIGEGTTTKYEKIEL